MDSKGIIMWVGLIIACAVIYFVSRRMKKQIEEEGIETTGVISRIVDASSNPTEVSYHYYVRFRTQEGEDIEALLSNYRDDLEEGQQVRIKYHPKYKENARLI